MGNHYQAPVHSLRGPNPGAATSAQIPPRVHVIDDDRAVRVALVRILSDLGYDARPFASAEDLIETLGTLPPGVLLIDFQLGDGNGLELLERLRKDDCFWPAAIMTGHGDIPLAVQAIRLGAYEFIEKPISSSVLERAVKAGVAALPDAVERSDRRREVRTLISSLSPRQLQVFEGVVEGLTSKEIARRHDLSHRTVESYRLAMTGKLGTKGMADLFEIKAILAETRSPRA